MRILPGIGAAGEWNGSVHNSQALAGQAEVIDGKRLRDCRFGIKVPDLAPLSTPPDELRKTLHPGLVAVKKQFCTSTAEPLWDTGLRAVRFWVSLFLIEALPHSWCKSTPPNARKQLKRFGIERHFQKVAGRRGPP